MQNDENTPELELDENQNQEEETNEQSDESSEQSKEIDWKAEALKQKAINQRLNKRFEKPEVKIEAKETNNGIDDATLARIYNIPEEDFEEVRDWAKLKKITLAEALKTDVIKTTLATKSEFRKTAEVSNTGPTKRGQAKISDDVLVRNVNEGKIPEKGSEEAERLFWARRGGKR